jgi:hypothetical protein
MAWSEGIAARSLDWSASLGKTTSNAPSASSRFDATARWMSAAELTKPLILTTPLKVIALISVDFKQATLKMAAQRAPTRKNPEKKLDRAV